MKKNYSHGYIMCTVIAYLTCSARALADSESVYITVGVSCG